MTEKYRVYVKDQNNVERIMVLTLADIETKKALGTIKEVKSKVPTW